MCVCLHFDRTSRHTHTHTHTQTTAAEPANAQSNRCMREAVWSISQPKSTFGRIISGQKTRNSWFDSPVNSDPIPRLHGVKKSALFLSHPTLDWAFAPIRAGWWRAQRTPVWLGKTTPRRPPIGRFLTSALSPTSRIAMRCSMNAVDSSLHIHTYVTFLFTRPYMPYQFLCIYL